MNQAKRDLQIFERELQDVVAYKDIKVEIDSFLIFADFFFDGFLADYLVQRKINQTRQEVEQAICHVERILSDLRRYNWPEHIRQEGFRMIDVWENLYNHI